MIARDKQLHFIAGAAIAVLFFFAALPFGLSPVVSGLVASAIAGVAKEAYDATGRGHVELADALWTATGGAMAVAVLALVAGA